VAVRWAEWLKEMAAGLTTTKTTTGASAKRIVAVTKVKGTAEWLDG